MASNTVYLITGANRGIGYGIVASYLQKPNNTVIATVRDATNTALTKDLSSLPTGESSKLIILTLEATHESAYNQLFHKITSEHGIDHIDVVVANAGVNYDLDPVATTSITKMKEYMEVNAYGPLLLFQAVLPLLEKSKTPKFVGMGSLISSLGNLERCPIPMTPYATSKIVVHWLSRKIHFEHNNIISFVVDPGFVQSDLGNKNAAKLGMGEAPTTIADAVKFITTTIDAATKMETSGHFPTIEGGDMLW